MPVVFADETGEVVEEVALFTGDAAPVVVMGPWRHDKQPTLGAGIELPPTGFLHRGETVFDEDNEGETRLKGTAHDFFLAWTDAWRDENCTTTGKAEVSLTLSLDFVLRERT